MSFPRQDSVVKRLQHESLADLEGVMDRQRNALRRTWGATRKSLKNLIRDAYKSAAPSGRWDIARYNMSGAANYLRLALHGHLEQFRAASTVAMRGHFREIKGKSILRHAWVLDQVTPHSVKVKLPKMPAIRESAITRISTVAWDTRWSQWVDSYAAALNNNLKMEAINESVLEDAEAEVDKTKVNTPSASIEDAMLRIYEYQSMDAWSAGEDAVVDENDDLVDTEVWKTRGINVCDDCANNEGLTVEEADGDIPLHPSCFCYWLVVPESYARLLRSGDEADRALARLMQAKGIVPEALVIRNDQGNIAGKVIVDFKEWVDGVDRSISGRL